MKKSSTIWLLVIAGLVLLSYVPAFEWMIDRWQAADTYYGHGFLVPFITGYIVWLKRNKLKELALKPTGWGWPILVVGVVVLMLSAVWRIYFSAAFSFLIVLVGLILLFAGKDWLKTLTFPLTFLLFMMPLPLVVISGISFKLKILASQISTAIINLLGVPAVREGSVIKTAHAYVVVEDPCSGIRSLIALIAIGALMAYFSRLSRVRKTVLFISSVPIAVATNVVRIVAVSLASEMYGMEFATGGFHDFMGMMVFVMAFAGLMLVANMLE